MDILTTAATVVAVAIGAVALLAALGLGVIVGSYWIVRQAEAHDRALKRG